MFVQERCQLSSFGMWSETELKIQMCQFTTIRRDGRRRSSHRRSRCANGERSDRRNGHSYESNERWNRTSALAAELWYEASQIQRAIMLVLEASGGSSPTGMTTEVVTGIRKIFQRLWRRSRNRGWTTRTARLQALH